MNEDVNSSLLNRAITEASKEAIMEEKNIRAILNVCLSGLVGIPSNLLLVAPPSEGKTTLIKSVLSVLPNENIWILRDASPKSFVHERGELALRVLDENGDKEYITKILNNFTNEEESVAKYLDYLSKEEKKLSSKKASDEDKKTLERIVEEKRKVTDNLVTLIDLEGRVIAFLDQPHPELLGNLLSVMSHDAFYTETIFTEGEGTKRTKHVVFKGWPSFIFATSKDSFLNWKDVETRFEVREPVMRPEKYNAALELTINKMFGMEAESDNELTELKKEIRNLIELILRDRVANEVNFLIPLDEKTIRQTLFPERFENGDVMRKIPMFISHIRANALWNYDKRVKLFGPKGIYILIEPDDIRSILKVYDDIELSSILSGISSSLYEFQSNVLYPLFQKDDLKQADIVDELERYVNSNPETRLKAGKMAVSRYLRSLEEKGFIKRIEDENDKRTKRVILLIDTNLYISGFKERIEQLIDKISNTVENSGVTILSDLLNKGYTAFFENKKIVTELPGIIEDDEKQKDPEFYKTCIIPTLELNILKASGYSPEYPPNVVTNFEISLSEIFTNFYFSHNEPMVINILQGTEEVNGAYDLDLLPDAFSGIPETVASKLSELGLGSVNEEVGEANGE